MTGLVGWMYAIWWFLAMGPKIWHTPQLFWIRTPSSGGVRRKKHIENVAMLLNINLHPTRVRTGAPGPRNRKCAGFSQKCRMPRTELSGTALK